MQSGTCGAVSSTGLRQNPQPRLTTTIHTYALYLSLCHLPALDVELMIAL